MSAPSNEEKRQKNSIKSEIPGSEVQQFMHIF